MRRERAVEADWEVEMGPRAPVIDALWEGFVDLTNDPALAKVLPEVAVLPQLEHALIRLNEPQSPVWTAKCDVWALDGPESFDPDELDAPEQDALSGWGCYVDLLPRSDQQWGDVARAVASCKYLCGQLHVISLRCCRADLVVRSAMMAPYVIDVGITAYLIACGATADDAKQVLGEALAGLANTVFCHSAVE